MKFAIQMEPETLLGQTVTHIMSRIYIHNYVYKNVFHNLLWYTLLILLNILCIYNYVYRNVFHSLLWYTLLVLLKYFRDCSFCSKRPHQQLYHNHESSLSSMPGNELSQNLARSPLPILTTVLTLITGGQYCHKVVVVPGYVRFYPLKPQPSYYLSCNALLKAWRSRTPRRPICFVAKLSSKQQDCDPHSATHPPSPFHRKLLLTLSILLSRAHFLRANTVRKYIGTEVRTDLTSVNHPALCSSFPFHDCSLAAILCINGCTSTPFNFLIFSGSPR